MESAFVFLTTVLIIAVIGVVTYVLLSRRSDHMLERWADENRYHLVRAERRTFQRGPFMWSGEEQVVYRVEVQDERGGRRRGWVRCGSWMLGLLSDKVEVKWD